jgi:hypothetical protein
MTSFLVIFAASMAGYAQIGIWAVAVGSLALLGLSYAERQRSISRAIDAGGAAFAEQSLLASLVNGLCATGAAYAFGHLLRLI